MLQGVTKTIHVVPVVFWVVVLWLLRCFWWLLWVAKVLWMVPKVFKLLVKWLLMAFG